MAIGWRTRHTLCPPASIFTERVSEANKFLSQIENKWKVNYYLLVSHWDRPQQWENARSDTHIQHQSWTNQIPVCALSTLPQYGFRMDFSLHHLFGKKHSRYNNKLAERKTKSIWRCADAGTCMQNLLCAIFLSLFLFFFLFVACKHPRRNVACWWCCVRPQQIEKNMFDMHGARIVSAIYSMLHKIYISLSFVQVD